MTVALITFKSYYLSTSKGISLLALPLIMILIFIFQNKNRTQLDDVKIVVNALVLVTCFTNINMISSSIAYDRHFIRLKLYKASHVNYHIYILGTILPVFLSTILSQAIILFMCSVFFNFDIMQFHITYFLLFSLISSLSLTWIGIYIGFYSKDSVTSHTISNLVSAFLTFFGGLFFPVSNFPLSFLKNFSKIIPLTYANQLFSNFVLDLLHEKTFVAQSSITILILLAYCLLSTYLIFAKNLWLKT